MSIFCYKKMPPCVHFGEKIKCQREKLGYTLKKVAESTRIPLKYLLALEAGNFADLPKTKAHRIAYVRSLAEYYTLPTQDAVNQFTKETGLTGTGRIHPYQVINFFPFSSIATFLRSSVFICLTLLFAGYLLWQVRGILEPPYLAVFSPGEGYIVNKPQTLIEGETEKETKLSVNGQEVMVNEAGHFSTLIDLSKGVNTIVVSVTKKHGKTTTITRHVVVRLPLGLNPSQEIVTSVK
jgi:hypothetical protein